MFKAIIVILCLVCALSCTNDDITIKDEEIVTDEGSCNEADSISGDEAVCDLDYIANYSGTACCVTGPVRATPGESLNYEYHSNIPNPSITWTVSGSITVTAGQNSSSVTLTFGEDFTTGCIKGLGDSEEKTCSETFLISKK